jgi:hypothetical protein
MSKYVEIQIEGKPNSINEVREILTSLNNRKEKIHFIEQLYNERKYFLKSFLNTIDITETATAITAKGLTEISNEIKENTLKNDEVLVFCQIELEYLKNLPDEQPNKPQTKTVPSTFEELFFVASNAEQCLQILKEIEPAVITDINHYMGSNKGIFPILMKELERTGLIRPQKPVVYKDLLNQRITGLNLSKDASEWRKVYKRLETDKTALSIKALISQYSQSGKLGK